MRDWIASGWDEIVREPHSYQQTPVISALLPSGVTAANSPRIGFTASDNWALYLGQIKLWVDSVQISAAALVVTVNDRLATCLTRTVGYRHSARYLFRYQRYVVSLCGVWPSLG